MFKMVLLFVETINAPADDLIHSEKLIVFKLFLSDEVNFW